MVNRHNLDYHQSPLRLVGMIYFRYSPLGALSVCAIFVEFSPKPVYPTGWGKIFQTFSVQFTRKNISGAKSCMQTFIHTPQAFIITPEVEGNYSFTTD